MTLKDLQGVTCGTIGLLDTTHCWRCMYPHGSEECYAQGCFKLIDLDDATAKYGDRKIRSIDVEYNKLMIYLDIDKEV